MMSNPGKDWGTTVCHMTSSRLKELGGDHRIPRSDLTITHSNFDDSQKRENNLELSKKNVTIKYPYTNNSQYTSFVLSPAIGTPLESYASNFWKKIKTKLWKQMPPHNSRNHWKLYWQITTLHCSHHI